MSVIDVERKFRVKGMDWVAEVTQSSQIEQGYLSFEPEVRVRIQSNPDKYTLAILAGRDTTGARRVFEYEVPLADAVTLIATSRHKIRKTRHKTRSGIVIDEIYDDRQPGILIMAEVKVSLANLVSMGDLEIQPPTWLGMEVTGQEEYTTAWLAQYGIQLYQL